MLAVCWHILDCISVSRRGASGCRVGVGLGGSGCS